MDTSPRITSPDDRRARPGMRRAARVALVAAGAVLLTLASSAVEGRRLEVQDWDCPPAPASCARRVVVVGYPRPYISDYHGLSPVGSADLVGAALGLDRFHVRAFWANVALYALLTGGVYAAWSRRGSGGRDGSFLHAAERRKSGRYGDA